MPRKRKLESEDERNARRQLAHEQRENGAREDDAVHAMVQNSIKLQGP